VVTAAGRAVNLLADLRDARFEGQNVLAKLAAQEEAGIRFVRHARTPEDILAWIDGTFGGTFSSEAAAASAWIARNERGPLGFAAFEPHGLRYHWLRNWNAKPSVAIAGPFGVAPTARKTGLAEALLVAALASLRERGFKQALFPAVGDERLVANLERVTNARVVENVDLTRRGRRARTTVLASGNGSNFQAVVDLAREGALPLDVHALVTNRPNAYVLERAAAAGVPATVVAWDRATESRDDYDARVLAAVAASEPELVLLLGWMHVLPPAFIARFPQLLNVHPALLPLDPSLDAVTFPDGTSLPAFRGPHAVDDALAAGSRWIGASVHRVGVAVDRGQVIARAPLALVPGEERAALDARLHALEHRVLEAALRRWAAEQP
jgi:phosphoribosylglycinamide formyltransferase-1